MKAAMEKDLLFPSKIKRKKTCSHCSHGTPTEFNESICKSGPRTPVFQRFVNVMLAEKQFQSISFFV